MIKIEFSQNLSLKFEFQINQNFKLLQFEWLLLDKRMSNLKLRCFERWTVYRCLKEFGWQILLL